MIEREVLRDHAAHRRARSRAPTRRRPRPARAIASSPCAPSRASSEPAPSRPVPRLSNRIARWRRLIQGQQAIPEARAGAQPHDHQNRLARSAGLDAGRARARRSAVVVVPMGHYRVVIRSARMSDRSLAGKTLFISGGSRGIGLAIAVRAARDGANVALIAKTAEPHPKLEGTVYTAAEAIEQAGGQALPIVGDIRDEEQVAAAVAAGGRALRRHRHLRQQRERDQPRRHRGARDEALRPDAGHQHARHVRREQGVHPAPQARPRTRTC